MLQPWLDRSQPACCPSLSENISSTISVPYSGVMRITWSNSRGRFVRARENSVVLVVTWRCLFTASSNQRKSGTDESQVKRIAYRFMTVEISFSSIILRPACPAYVPRSSPSCSKNQSLASTIASKISLLMFVFLSPADLAKVEERLLITPMGRDGYGIPRRDVFKGLGTLGLLSWLGAMLSDLAKTVAVCKWSRSSYASIVSPCGSGMRLDGGTRPNVVSTVCSSRSHGPKSLRRFWSTAERSMIARRKSWVSPLRGVSFMAQDLEKYH